MEAKWSSLVSYGMSLDALQDFLPLDLTLDVKTVRYDTLKVAKRLEAALGEEQSGFIEGDPSDGDLLPLPDGSFKVGIDGGYLRNWVEKTHKFEVIVGKSIRSFEEGEEDRTPSLKRFGFVQTYDDAKPKRRLHEVVHSQGLQMHQAITFLSDGDDTLRALQLEISPKATHILDWFHLTMKFTMLGQYGNGLVQCEAMLGEQIQDQIGRMKWRMVKKLETSLTTALLTLPSCTQRLAYYPHHQAYSLPREGRTNGEDRRMDWKTLLAYITGTVDQELLLRNEYLVTENRILRHQLKGRARLSDGERKTLAEIGYKLGKHALEDVATIVKPDTILGWHRKLVAQKFDGSAQRKAPGRPPIDPELEALVVRMAQENRSWGYDRIVGALANLGYTVSDQTVGNILKRHGIPPAPERKLTTTWKEFIRTHLDLLVATDFFTTEVWTWGRLITYYVLFFIHLGSRKVHVAGVTAHPNEAWMTQVARNVTMEAWGCLSPGHYLIHDRDGKYCPAFQHIIDAAGVTRIPLPPRSPNLNAYAERWVRSVKEECLTRVILFGEAALSHALHEYGEHYHHERNHQGKGNVRLFPAVDQGPERAGPIRRRERLGGLLKYYEREAA